MGVNAQMEEVTEHTLPAHFQHQSVTKKGSMAVNDTVIPSISCPSGQGDVTIITGSGGRIITGTYQLSTGDTITKVGQLLNLDDRTMDVYSILAFTVYKAAGPTPGSFTAAVHDTVNGLSNTPMATSTPVPYANIKDTNSTGSLLTQFPFSTPVTVNHRFWAVLDVFNDADTISLASTASGCGGNAVMNVNDSQWALYSSVFTMGGNPIVMSVHLWAEVERNDIGLDRHLVSRSGVEFYPNPAQDMATIEYDMAGENNITLNIQDLSGRSVFSRSYEVTADNKIELDLSGFESGAYTYQVIGSKQQLNGVFVKK